MQYRTHIYALNAVAKILFKLPSDAVWALTLTDVIEDGQVGVFNIYVKSESERLTIRKLLNLNRELKDEGDYFETYRVNGLELSIIEEKDDFIGFSKSGEIGEEIGGSEDKDDSSR